MLKPCRFVMKPSMIETPPQDDWFRSRLKNIISLRHPLVRLADSIDLAHLNGVLGEFYEKAVVEQPPKPTLLVVGRLHPKHTCGLSDDAMPSCTSRACSA